MVGQALSRLDPPDGSLLLIENVGNLVCPAAFDLGEAHKVVILSVTEGEDKPLKYPDMFHAADLLLINKIDLLPYVRVRRRRGDRVRAPRAPRAARAARLGDDRRRLRRVARVARAGCRRGAGSARPQRRGAAPSRIAELEAELARRAGRRSLPADARTTPLMTATRAAVPAGARRAGASRCAASCRASAFARSSTGSRRSSRSTAGCATMRPA